MPVWDNLLKNLGQWEPAQEKYRKAMAILEKLAAEHPAVPGYRNDLASIHSNLGNLHERLRQTKAAHEEHERALSIWQKLVDEFPAVPDYLSDQAGTHNNIGLLLQGSRQWKQAQEQYERALAIQAKLVEDFPTVAGYRVRLGANYCNIGNVIRDSGRPSESLPWFGKAMDALQTVLKVTPRDATARQFLMNSHWGRAMAHDLTEKYADAVKDWEKVLELSPKQNQSYYRAMPP